MIGDKPDPRLRTPMQWSPRAGLGFTTGTEWESAQPDSLTTTVEAQNEDAGSLLNLYRRLIHLRKEHEALASGALVPLSANSAQVAAYLRRAGDRAVLVVANLGSSAVSGLSVGSVGEALPAGRYAARSLLGGADGAGLRVGGDGAIRAYVPIPGTVAARAILLFDLVRR